MKSSGKKVAVLLWLGVLLLPAGGCEVVGKIFQAGVVVGIAVAVVILAALFWAFRKFRGS